LAEKVTPIIVLNDKENRELSSISLNRFDPISASAGAIRWDTVPYTERFAFENESEGVRRINELLSHFFEKESGLVIFWNALDVPSVFVPPELVIANLREVIDFPTGFWIFSIDSNMIMECNWDWEVTLAKVPQMTA
jgi:hypothetical protein